MSLVEEDITGEVIGAAIEVHRQLGPGLLEKVYHRCLAHELSLRGLAVQSEVQLPLVYKGVTIGEGYRMDLVVAERIVVEVKAVDAIVPVHDAQLLTYLKLSGLRIGLLLNFKSKRLRDGILRRVLG